MRDGEEIVQRLAECGAIEFNEYDLKYIQKALKLMLKATDKTIDKIQDASPTRRNRMEITEEYFVEKTGWPPVDDDLERCNCDKGGQEGHSCCGWCDIHDLPIFQCGCVRLGMDGD